MPSVLSGREGGGGRRSVDVMLPGQEGSGVRLYKGSVNQLCCWGGRVARRGGGGGTAYATAAVGNNVPLLVCKDGRLVVRRQRWRGR